MPDELDSRSPKQAHDRGSELVPLPDLRCARKIAPPMVIPPCVEWIEDPAFINTVIMPGALPTSPCSAYRDAYGPA